jgi:integrase
MLESAYQTRNCKENIKRQLDSIVRDIDPDLCVHTVGAYFKSWIVVYGGELSDSSLSSYSRQMKNFEKYYGADKTMTSVKQIHALEFRGIIAETASNSTANHAVKIMRAVFGRAMSTAVIVGNPFDIRIKLQNDSVTKKPFTMEQVKHLLGVADPEWQSLIKFAIFTGQRLGDLVDLKWENIDFARKEVNFTTQKTGRLMALPANDELWAHIEALTKGEPQTPLHPKMYELKRRTNVGSVSNTFTRLMARAGLCEKRSTTKRTTENAVSRKVNPCTFHSFRHSAASWLRDSGASESLAMEIIGHNSVSVDRAYVHTEPDRLRQALNKISLA